jgi:mono/diheme cytochrome c family protein
MRAHPVRLSLVLAALFCVGCARAVTATPASPTATAMWDALANGRAIFQNGRDLGGAAIAAQSTPLYNRCAACHRADGSGGMHFKDGAVSADLRYRALVTEQQHPYTLRLLERAISTGIDNDGHTLDKVMPRWKLSARDLHDVALYVSHLR